MTDAEVRCTLLKVRASNVRAGVMRTRRQSGHHQSGSAVVLAQLVPRQRATIVGTVPQATAAVANRLRQLGFRPTVHVDVIRRAPLGDPTIYRVQDTELCLRRREARLIEVVPEVES
jgi:ferrous iron transport protein A